MTDVKAPERIWVTGEYRIWPTFRSFTASDLDHSNDDGTCDYPEYVRADLYDALAKERDELRADIVRYRARLLDDLKSAKKAEAEVERLRNVITVELTEARRIADAELESQAAMERVMDYPMERTYTPAMKRFDRLNAALQRKEGNE